MFAEDTDNLLKLFLILLKILQLKPAGSQRCCRGLGQQIELLCAGDTAAYSIADGTDPLYLNEADIGGIQDCLRNLGARLEI